MASSIRKDLNKGRGGGGVSAPLPCWCERPCAAPWDGMGWRSLGVRGEVFFVVFFFNNIFLMSFFFNYLIIYLFLAVLGLRFCARAFSSCGKRGPLFIAVRGPLIIAASLVAEHRLQTRRLSSCGSRA